MKTSTITKGTCRTEGRPFRCGPCPFFFFCFRWQFHSKSRFQRANYPWNSKGGPSNWNGRVRRSFEVLPVEVSTTRAGLVASSLELNIEENGSKTENCSSRTVNLIRDCVRAARSPIRHIHTHKDIYTHTLTLTRTQPNRWPVRTHPLAHSCTRVHIAYIKSKEKSIGVH